MASQSAFDMVRGNARPLPELGPQPFNRDNPWLAFGRSAARPVDGQSLAGTGALVFEGELLEIPAVN